MCKRGYVICSSRVTEHRRTSTCEGAALRNRLLTKVHHPIDGERAPTVRCCVIRGLGPGSRTLRERDLKGERDERIGQRDEEVRCDSGAQPPDDILPVVEQRVAVWLDVFLFDRNSQPLNLSRTRSNPALYSFYASGRGEVMERLVSLNQIDL